MPVRFLLISPNFAPELVGIGRYNAELSEYLAGHGVEVLAIVPPPHYPGWRVFKGYRASSCRSERIAGAMVLRSPVVMAGGGKGIGRIAFMLSFALVGFFQLLRANLSRRGDWIFATVPNSFAAWAAIAVGRMLRVRTWVHIQDFELDIAANMGLVGGGGFLFRCVDAVDSWFLRRASVVSSISGKMFEKLLQKGVARERACLVPNWAPATPNADAAIIARLRRELALLPTQRIALYAGTMSRKQGLPLLGDCAHQLKGRPDLVFVFCGEGVAREELERQCADLDNVRIHDFVPNDDLSSLLAMADVHLLPQRAAASDLVMPSKLNGMLLSAKPVIANAEAGSEVAAVLAGRGVVVPPDDSAAMCRAIESLLNDPAMAESLGHAGKVYACENLLREKILARFMERLNEPGA